MTRTCWCGTTIEDRDGRKSRAQYCKPEHRPSAYQPIKTGPPKRTKPYAACSVCSKPHDQLRRTSFCRECNRDARTNRLMHDQLETEQNGVCAICHRTEVGVSKFGKIRKLSVDHCHKDGHVRGLLCARCNRLLGLAHDDPHVFDVARAYIARHQRSASIHVPTQRAPAEDNAESGVTERTELIIQLRNEGGTFKAIGQRLGLTRQRVTQIWERSQQPEPMYHTCWCGIVITQTTQSGRPRKFCSPEHRPTTTGPKNFTHEHHTRMSDAQNHECAICGHVESKLTGSGQPHRLRTDVSPDTGSVRQLLCSKCHILLNSINDDVATLLEAAAYLRKHQKS